MIKKIAILSLVLLVTGFGCKQPEPVVEDSTNSVTTTQPEVRDEKIKEILQMEEAVKNTKVNDADFDGLSNEEEVKQGTNQNKPDTDGDGLLDRDEVQKHKTNPLKPDTDGDGKLDGDEVKFGTNPLMSGK